VAIVGTRAVVIGGSIGGLVAAQVLSSRFESVTVLDRDRLPAEPRDRRGVPHGVHAHALLIGGRLALEKLYPGLTDELIAGGAVPFDPGMDLLFVQMGALRIRFSSGMLGISMSRAFLEFTICRRVAALSNVEMRDDVAACGLTGSTERVTGVEIDGGDGAGTEVLPADLVVDATGRGGGQVDRWMERLACAVPQVATVKIDVGYTTRLLRRREGDLPDGGLLSLMASTPPYEKSAGAAFPIERDRWVVTIGGWHREHAPADPDGFAEFAARLPARHIADLIKRAEPAGDLETRKFPAARRRYYERLRRPPAGYVALGDTICSFNPLYGQGMTVATLEAIQLGRCLDRRGESSGAMARDYYAAAAKVIETPWQMATGGDFMYPETVGPKPPGTDLLNWYARRALLASHVSVPVHRVLLDVQHMLAPPAALLRPGTVARSLWSARRSPARVPARVRQANDPVSSHNRPGSQK
jgi:2-polyprenyl-6-methoxyphenol hydroxylase-like FAD-dependent oxidoreductase